MSTATVFGGIVFFPSFTPTNDICASTGTSNLYALFYKTGGPYTEPIIGSTAGAGGVANVNRSTSLGAGWRSEPCPMLVPEPTEQVRTSCSLTPAAAR